MRRHRGEIAVIIGLALVAAVLRFATLEAQSFGGDELFTAWLVRLDLGEMLATIPDSERTPPLYYLLAWGWAKLFGTGEAGLRSLSAILGTLTVPVAYSAGRTLIGRRAALVTAALVAANPLLIWYSQEARSYALVVLLTSLSLIFFVRALQRGPSGGTLVGWAVASALALATHYFATFLVAPEAAWLIIASSRSRSVLISVGAVSTTGAALLPLALEQRSVGLEFEASLATRLAQIPKTFLVAFSAPAEAAAFVVAALLAGVGLALLVRAPPAERGRAAIPAALAAASVGVPAAMAVTGLDYIDSKNVIIALLPSAVVLAAGFARSSHGLAAALALVALSVALVVAVAVEPSYQRLDWRGAATALGPPRSARGIVISPSITIDPFRVYVPGAQRMPPEGAELREIAVVGLAASRGRFTTGTPSPPRPRHPPIVPRGFRLVQQQMEGTYTLFRYRARQPRPVPFHTLAGLKLGPDAVITLQRRRPL